MQNTEAGAHWVIATIAFVLPIGLGCSFSPAEQPSTPPDWQAQFLAQAPGEYGRLEATVSRWEIRFLCQDTSYQYMSSKIARQSASYNRTIFDDRLGGLRSESKVVGVPGMLVEGDNPQYKFEAESGQGRPFMINWFKDSPDQRKPWLDEMRGHWGLVAEDFNGRSVLELIQEGALKIKSVSHVEVNGHQCIRVDCDVDEIWKSPHTDPTHFYPGWFVIDPSFHWAIRSYEQDNSLGRKRTVSTEYSPTITEVAYPKRCVWEDFAGHEHVALRMVMDFEDPRPSTAVAKDFTLESVGLERPLSKVESRKRNLVVIVLINGGCLVTLVVWFVLYRRSKRRTGTGGLAPRATA